MDSLYVESPIEELNRFRNFQSDPDNIEIPLRPEHRRTTDRMYLLTFVAAIIILVPFMVYTLMHASLHNLAEADDCGNFCGYQNEKYDDWDCTGKDFTDKKYILITNESKMCLDACPAHSSICKDNLKDSSAADYENFIKDTVDGWWIIVLSLIITCSLCFVMILLFKYAVDFVVWFFLIGSIGVMMIGAGLCWIRYFEYVDKADQGAAETYLTWAIVLTTFVAFLVILLTCMIKRVKLIIELFKESAKCIFEVPGLLFLPLMTFVALTTTLIVFSILLLLSITARKLIEIGPNHLDYQIDGAMIFTMCFHSFVFVWVMQFMAGAQYLIISGAISSWFFTRNKHYLDAPLWTSFLNFIKYHLGTVFIGSLIMTIMQILRIIVRVLSSHKHTRWLVNCCCNELIAFLKLFSKNAYIQTAMHGQPFFKSGKRALYLLVSNVENVVAINSIGDFILFMAQALLIVVSGAIGYVISMASGNPQAETIGATCLILAVIMVIIFFNIFEATIDSIFLCFCEDTLINDGMARPFYMTKGLHQFMENCKGVIPAKK